MNWDAISSISQVAGGLLIVVSLLYLAIQTRLTRRHSEASTQSNWMDGWNNTIKGWIESPETISILRRGFNNLANLNKDEQAVFHLHMAALNNQWVNAVELHKRRLFPESYYRAVTDVAISTFSTTGGLDFLKKNSKGTPRGEELLELVLANQGNLPPISELFPWWSLDDA